MGKSTGQRGTKPGTVLAGRYEIGELLGEGGFGVAYKATDLSRFGAVCVVKQLHSSQVTSDTARRLFEREARLLSELEQPRIPKLQAYFETRGRYYLVQDFVEGETLRARLTRDAKLDEPTVRDVVLQVLDVLEYLHGRTPPVIHRDIKPANLIAGTDGRIHLIDFGAVREAVETPGDGGGTRIGTAGYTPAEQAMGHAVPASDLYALGATALHLLSGVEPRDWFADGVLAWRGHLQCSAGFAAFLDGTLAPLPDRIKTARAARDTLGVTAPASNAATVIAPEISSPTTPATVAPPRAPSGAVTGRRDRSDGSGGVATVARRSRTPVYALGAVLITAGIVTAALLRRNTGPTADPVKPPGGTDTVGAPATVAGDPCAERTIRTFRTGIGVRPSRPVSRWVDLVSIAGGAGHAHHVGELADTGLGERLESGASGRTDSRFCRPVAGDHAGVLGPMTLELSSTPDERTARYRVVGSRFANTETGSLQIERSPAGGNVFFIWSLLIGAGTATHATAQEVLTSIEYLASDPARAGVARPSP